MTLKRVLRNGLGFAVIAASLGAVVLTAQDDAAAKRAARLQKIAAGLEQNFSKTQQQLDSKDPTLDVRGVAGYALFRAISHKDGPGAEQAWRDIFHLQDMRPDSPHYGELPWNVFNEDIKDENAIEFGTHFLGPLLLGYGQLLSPEFVKEAHAHASAALVALQRHHPPVSYTNIFLMNTDATILLAQAVGDKAQAERGRQQLAAWMQYTSQYGIHEFDSPTYTAEDLNDLSLCAHYTTDPEEHAELVAALDYLWKDIALNVSPAMHRPLVGSHSRDYDFLGRSGGLGLLEWAAGLIDEYPFKGVDPSKVGILDYTQPSGYLLDAAKLRGLVPDTRIVTQRWGENESQIRYTDITPGFAVGIANGDYGPQDRMFAVDLASSKPLPTISIVPDRFDAPYGLPEAQSKDRSGHVKPKHMPLHPVFLQKEGSVLALLDLDLTGEKGLTSAATDIILPARADEIRLNKTAVDAGKLSTLDATPNDVIGVREAGSCFALRFVHVDPLGTEPPVYQLKADAAGRAKGAIRFVVYHAQKTPSELAKNLRVMILSETGVCPAGGLPEFMDKLDHANASFDRKDGRINVQATLAAGQFAISMRDDARTAGSETIDGVTPHSPPLAYNGQAIPLLPPSAK